MLMSGRQAGYFVVADPETDDGSFIDMYEYVLDQDFIHRIMEEAKAYHAFAIFPSMVEKWHNRS